MTFFEKRHAALAAVMGSCGALLCSGFEHSRNYPANSYPFRTASHFLYFAGQAAPGTYFLLCNGQGHLFVPEFSIDDIIWSGPGEAAEDAAARTGCQVHPLSELEHFVRDAGADNIAALPLPDAGQNACFENIIGRRPDLHDARDSKLAEAVINLRLHLDAAAESDIKEACRLTVKAHLAGLSALPSAHTEHDINAAMLNVVNGCGGCVSFNPIISTSGERLHQAKLGAPLAHNRLLLVDFGVESASGWAGDITNTWPVSGRYSKTQADIYNVVLKAHRRCVAKIKAGVRYRDIHRTAVEVFAEGLAELGILRGASPEVYIESNAVSLFFPHGIGHLMGLDVHDMEDLGDLAGYAPGRTRSKLFGWNCLRFDRDLEPGMVFTIEPGLYFIPELFEQPEFAEITGKYVCREKLAEYGDVHGVRIERDYAVKADGTSELLTPGMPDEIEEIEDRLAR